MDSDIKKTKSVHKCKLDCIQDAQHDLDRPVPDNHQPEAIRKEMKSNEKEVLFSRWKKAQEYMCLKSQHAGVKTVEDRFFKVQQSLVQNTNGNDNHDLNQQAIESLQRILAEANKEPVMSIQGPKYDFQMDQGSKSIHLPFSYLIRSNSTRSVECSSNPPKVTVKELSKGRDRSRAEKSSSFKGKHLDFFEIVKEQLQQKDLENQHIIQLLLVNQQELKDTKEILKEKKREILFVTKKLECEKQKNIEITARFDKSCEDMKKDLTQEKNNSKSSMKQLKALMEKYERLKTRATALKDQLKEELDEKKSCQKSLKKLQQMSQELLTKQKLMEEQRDVEERELALCRETLQMMDSEHKKNTSIIQRLEEEVSAMRSESANLRDYLQKAQEKNKELIQSTCSKESDNEKNVKELQDIIENLKAELEKNQTEKDKAHQQVETIKYESKLIHNKQRVEILQLQEQQKAFRQQIDSLRRECETLMEVVNKVKKDKQVLTEKLETIHKDKMVSEMASTKKGEQLKEAIHLLEREREVLLAEMDDLRKDYLSLSDRITQKMVHMDAADPPMTITDITTIHQRSKPKLSPTDDVIQNIRRKLEEETNLHTMKS